MFTEEAKKKQLIEYTDHIPEGMVEIYRKLVFEGLEKDWDEAYYAKGYSCYGGNEAFECDWYEAKRCIEILAERTGSPDYYNTLGYIYYYGRCNNRIPEYDKAFQCFSIGHACGLFESTYKLADMFQHGYGTPKSPLAAASLLHSILDENYEHICDGHFECKFADVALRVGGLYENGIGVEKDLEHAYCSYIEAKYAIERRIGVMDYYGDGKVKKSIDEAIARVKPQLDTTFFRKSIDIPSPGPIGEILSKNVGINVTYGTENGRDYIEAEAFGDEDGEKAVLFTIPGMDFCELRTKIRLYIIGNKPLVQSTTNPMHAFVTGIHYDEEEDVWMFCCSDQPVIMFQCDGFVFEG